MEDLEDITEDLSNSKFNKVELDNLMESTGYELIGEVKPYLIYANGMDRIAVERFVSPSGITYDIIKNYIGKTYYMGDIKEEPKYKRKNPYALID